MDESESGWLNYHLYHHQDLSSAIEYGCEPRSRHVTLASGFCRRQRSSSRCEISCLGCSRVSGNSTLMPQLTDDTDVCAWQAGTIPRGTSPTDLPP